MKYLTGGSYIEMNIESRYTGDMPIMSIGHMYKPRKNLGFTDTKRNGVTFPYETYLYHCHDIFPDVFTG